MFEYLLFSMPVLRTVWRRELDWILFVKKCMLLLPSETGGLHRQWNNGIYSVLFT